MLVQSRDMCPNHYERKTRYKLTLEQLEEFDLRKECEICKTNFPTDVDHCHKSNKIRGYLCGSCNRALGMLRDDPVIARLAAEYLERHAND